MFQSRKADWYRSRLSLSLSSRHDHTARIVGSFLIRSSHAGSWHFAKAGTSFCRSSSISSHWSWKRWRWSWGSPARHWPGMSLLITGCLPVFRNNPCTRMSYAGRCHHAMIGWGSTAWSNQIRWYLHAIRTWWFSTSQFLMCWRTVKPWKADDLLMPYQSGYKCLIHHRARLRKRHTCWAGNQSWGSVASSSARTDSSQAAWAHRAARSIEAHGMTLSACTCGCQWAHPLPHSARSGYYTSVPSMSWWNYLRALHQNWSFAGGLAESCSWVQEIACNHNGWFSDRYAHKVLTN